MILIVVWMRRLFLVIHLTFMVLFVYVWVYLEFIIYLIIFVKKDGDIFQLK